MGCVPGKSCCCLKDAVTLLEQNCTLKAYSYAETVFPTFHHNPTVRRLTASQSGTSRPLYAMYFIGMNEAPPRGAGAACSYDPSLDPRHGEGYISMALTAPAAPPPGKCW